MDKCQLCGQPAHPGYRVVHVRRNKAVGEQHLCERCGVGYVSALFDPPPAQPPGVAVTTATVTSAVELLNLLLGLGMPTPPPVQKKDLPPCPGCGHTVTDLQKSGKFGCPGCYHHFGEEVGPSDEGLIVSVVNLAQKGALQHCGKVPKRHRQANASDPLDQLRLKLARAVEHEQFEEAARIRDLIKAAEPQP